MNETAIPAATLVLFRDQAAQPDLLTVTRGQGMAFAGGAIAFPGGRVDDSDRELGQLLADDLAAWKVAAIRETIEETAVPAALDPMPSHELALQMQRQLHGGKAFGSLLDEHRLTLRLDSLTAFARWKPAFAHARTFDTFFFVAPAPQGNWEPVPQPGECEGAVWVSAQSVLDQIDKGEAHAIFPTKRNLERLARFETLADAVKDAGAFSIETITPWVEEIRGVKHVCIPQGRGYPVTSEPLATAFRA